MAPLFVFEFEVDAGAVGVDEEAAAAAECCCKSFCIVAGVDDLAVDEAAKGEGPVVEPFAKLCVEYLLSIVCSNGG